MKRKAILFSALLAVALAAGVSGISGQPRDEPGWGMMGPGWGPGMMGRDRMGGPRSMMGMGCPMMGLNSGPMNGPGFAASSASGLLRSQARASKSPKTWQLAHAWSPWLEVVLASYKNGRPCTTETGSGFGSATLAVCARVAKSITLTELSKRVTTYKRLRGSSSARPLGPPPVTEM